MGAVLRVPKAVWRGLRRFASLVHNYDEVRAVYGDNPNGLSDEERLTAHAVASNTINVGQSGW